LPPPAQAGKPTAEGDLPAAPSRHTEGRRRRGTTNCDEKAHRQWTISGEKSGKQGRAGDRSGATTAGDGGMRPHSQLSKPPRPHHHESARSPAGAPRSWSTTTPSSPTSGTVVFPTLAEKLRHSGGARDTRPSPSCPQPAPPPRSSRRSSLHSFPTSRIRGRGGVKAERGRVAGAAMVASSGPDPAVGSSQ
jgi:hypothetical protein